MNISQIGSVDAITKGHTYTSEIKETESFQNALEDAVKKQDEAQLLESCQEVEQYMLSMIFKQMKASTVVGERLIEKGDYEEMFESHLIDEQCKQMVKAGGVGLADMMYRQLSREL